MNFSYKFKIPTKDFKKYEEKELTIHTIIKDSHLTFFLTIPAHIFKMVFNTDKKYLDEFIEKSYVSPVLNKKTRFRNKLKSEVFQDLVNRFEDICKDAMQVQAIIDSEKSKVILVKFSKEDTTEEDELNRATKGRKLTSRFQYFICYRRTTKDFVSGKLKNYYEALEIHKHGGFKRYFDDVEHEFDVIKWTQEREDFFKNIEETFVKLNNKLEEFFGKLTTKKVEELMTLQKQMNLLPAYEVKKTVNK
jgi:hypothetical protein